MLRSIDKSELVFNVLAGKIATFVAGNGFFSFHHRIAIVVCQFSTKGAIKTVNLVSITNY